MRLVVFLALHNTASFEWDTNLAIRPILELRDDGTGSNS